MSGAAKSVADGCPGLSVRRQRHNKAIQAGVIKLVQDRVQLGRVARGVLGHGHVDKTGSGCRASRGKRHPTNMQALCQELLNALAGINFYTF